MPKNTLKIGAVFTPLEWGFFAIDAFQVFEQWLKGATIFDPTMGNAHLLEALVAYGLQKGHPLETLPLHRLYGNELNQEFYLQALEKFQEQFQTDMSENFFNLDIFEMPARQFDIILGNPPWQNFVDLPEAYRPQFKQWFEELGLVESRQKLLLGNSRIDIAALVIQRVMRDFLTTEGHAYFFAPLSLLLNDGAHKQFRNFKVGKTSFALTKVYDFNDAKIFDDVNTRYGLMQFSKHQTQAFPIDYFSFREDRWHLMEAYPLFQPNDPLSIVERGTFEIDTHWPLMELPKASTPRQGVNTCGANAIFFFDSCEALGNGLSKVNGTTELPTEYLYPLLTKENFEGESQETHKWVLLPYHTNGKPLSWEEISKSPTLANYLLQHQAHLSQRKGVMLKGFFKRGCWWALLGVGPYSFFPFKVVWEAYGRKTFRPMLVKGEWQANQSLQAFIPMQSVKEAQTLLKALQEPRVEAYLHSLQMAGTMNWAQPGKIKKLLKILG